MFFLIREEKKFLLARIAVESPEAHCVGLKNPTPRPTQWAEDLQRKAG